VPSVSHSRQAAVAVGAFRMAYGVFLAAAPKRASESWLGPDGSRPATVVALRCLAAREIAIHAGAIVAALRGAPVQPWLIASIGGDCADIASTFGGGSHLPDGAAVKTAAVAGGSAALSAAVLAGLDE
jgi:hypothetical protein